MTDKFCVNCTYYKHAGFGLAFCREPSAQPPRVIDVVTGVDKTEPVYCVTARTASRKCGPEGKLFAPRPAPIPEGPVARGARSAEPYPEGPPLRFPYGSPSDPPLGLFANWIVKTRRFLK